MNLYASPLWSACGRIVKAKWGWNGVWACEGEIDAEFMRKMLGRVGFGKCPGLCEIAADDEGVKVYNGRLCR